MMMRRSTLAAAMVSALLILAVSPARLASAQEKLAPEPLVPGNSLITETPEQGRALAITLARHSIHAMQNNIPVLVGGRPKYANDPNGLIAASQVIAIEFATIAAANNYWKK